MRKLLLAAFVLLVFPPTTFSQSEKRATLTVNVTDPQGARVDGATVRLHTRDDRVRIAARTDTDGEYRFQNLAPGEYLVDAEAPGFARAEARSVRVDPGKDGVLSLTLKIAAFREEVVVTASSTVQTVDEISKAINIVDAVEIDQRDEYSIPEALRRVPGLTVQQLGGAGSFVSIKTRGLRNEDTAVLIDGIRFRDAAAPQGDATAFLQDLIVTDVERVEVLRGSGSSLYGSNAIGGVINIVSRDGGGRTHGELLTEGGSFGFFRARGQTSGGTDGDKLTYSVGVSHLNVSEGVDGNDQARNTSGQGRARLRLSPTAGVSARVYASKSSLMLNESPQGVGQLPPTGIIDAKPLPIAELKRYESGSPISELSLDGANFIPSADDPDNEQESHFVSTLLSFEQRPNPALGYTIRYHRLATQRTLLDGPRGATFFEPSQTARSEFDGRIHNLDARLDFEGGATHFISTGYGLESESYHSRSAGLGTESSVDVSQRSHTLFIQDQVRLVDGTVHLSGAFRTQLFTMNEPQFTPSEGSPYRNITVASPESAYTGDGSVAYFFRQSGTKIRAHVGNGYRAPSLFERFGSFYGSFGYSVFGDPRLEPERSVAFDTGVDQDLAGGRLRASATFFYTRLLKVILFDFSGVIDPSTDPFGRFGGYRRVDGGRARGLELSASATAGGLRMGLAYTYTDAEPPSEGFEELPQAFAIPRHQFSLVATQRLSREFYISFDLAWSDSYLVPIVDLTTFASRSYRFDGLVKADLGASYRWRVSNVGNLRLFAKVDNLFDQEFYANGFRTPGRMGYGGVGFEF